MKESNFAAPKDIVMIVLNGARFEDIAIDPSRVYTPEKPVSLAWRKTIITDSVPLDLNQAIKTHHQARKEFFENMGI